MIEIIVTPLGRGRYQAHQGDRVLVRSTSEPLVAAARALLAEGVAPNTRIATRYAGATHDALRSQVGKAAKLTVKEATSDGRPRFARWKPSPYGDVPPPMRFGEEEAPDIGAEAGALSDDPAYQQTAVPA